MLAHHRLLLVVAAGWEPQGASGVTIKSTVTPFICSSTKRHNPGKRELPHGASKHIYISRMNFAAMAVSLSSVLTRIYTVNIFLALFSGPRSPSHSSAEVGDHSGRPMSNVLEESTLSTSCRCLVVQEVQ